MNFNAIQLQATPTVWFYMDLPLIKIPESFLLQQTILL